MKVAHLILAHHEPLQLKRLVDRLCCEEAVYFIHIDLKADIRVFTEVFIGYKQVYFIKKRVSITWASYSMVQATLNGFAEIKSAGLGVDYINLLSGQDYLLQPIKNFHQFLKNHAGKAFMHCLDVNKEWTEAISRLEEYHLTNFRDFPGKYKIQYFINKLLPKRKMPENMVPVGRSQWFTITYRQMEYILAKMEASPFIARFFKLTWAPDEIIFQTLLFNSDYRQSIINNNLRYIDWSKKEKNPKLLVTEDFQKIHESDCFFARKFDQNIDQHIFKLIDESIGWQEA
ncbi:MAG: glycosyl transferase [Sphingobacteriia bacterium]|nr:MAG: glycosyl transferase [Sphingobacteriia bacterium]TAH07823.1 MAG: glycosyl transferase [Sphingobacteriia bacterium]